MKIERTKNATRNIVFGTLQRIYQIFIPFIMRTALIYFMGIKYLGLNSLFISILQVLNLAELGVGSAMVYSMYKPIAEDNEAMICALMKLYRKYYRIIGMVIAGIGIVLTPAVPYLVEGDLPDNLNIYVLYIMNLASTVLSYWLFAYKNCILVAFQRIDITSKISLIITTVQYVTQLLIIIYIKNYYIYLFVAIIMQIAANITTAIIVKKMYPQFVPSGEITVSERKLINGRVKDLFTSKLGYTIVTSADTIVISTFLGLEILAIYQNYFYIVTSVIGFMMIAMNSCTAAIGNSLVTESIEKNYKDMNKLSFLLSWFNVISVSCMMCLYQPFMKLWVGENLMLPVEYVILFCVYYYVYSTNQLLCTYKDASGLWHDDRFRPLTAAMFNLILNIIFVTKFGLFAVLLSTILSYVLVGMPWLIKNIFSLLFKRSPKEYICKQFMYLLITVILVIISYSICCYLPGKGMINILLRLCVCILVSILGYVVIMSRSKEFNEGIMLINNITKGRLNIILRHLIK